MSHDPGPNHAKRRAVVSALKRGARTAGAPRSGQGALSQSVTYFNATVIAAEPSGGGNLYQVQHAAGEIYRGVPVMAHVVAVTNPIPNGTVVSIRKVGNRLVVDGIPLGNADAFVGP